MTGNAPTEDRLGLNVRLRYASILNYVLNIGGIFFGFLFITLVARRLTVEEYGVWVMILRYVSYLIIPGAIYSYWLPRNISRGQNTSRTGLYTSIVFGFILVPFYFLMVQTVSRELDQPIFPLALSSIILLLEYINTSLGPISSGHAPQITGYGTLVLKIGQAVSAYLLIGFWSLGLAGAVIAAVIGRVCLNVVSLMMNRHILRGSRFDPSVLRSWLRASWLPIFAAITLFIPTFDVVVVRIFFGSEVPVAYYGIATGLLSIALVTAVVSTSLYPKILAKRNLEDLREGIWLILLLSLPVLYLILLYAEPLSALFGVKYLPVAWPLRVLAVASLLQLLSGLAGIAYFGLEGADEEALSSKILLRSAIFKSNLVNFIIGLLYLASLAALSFLALTATSYVELWGVASIISYALSFVILTMLIKRDFGQTFPFRTIARDFVTFTVPAIPMCIPFLLFRVQVAEIFYQMVLNLIPPALASLLLYFATLYAIEGKFRSTVRDAVRRLLFINNKQRNGIGT
ncbi:MAG: hypothetical protein FJZ49_02195 [Candidatus Verstraetearchaeota archaeon]|nr:hypothetical protein [Candidatus Verstraetearchaeota archaeon]